VMKKIDLVIKKMSIQIDDSPRYAGVAFQKSKVRKDILKLLIVEQEALTLKLLRSIGDT
jgi:hypothetical protein